MYIDVLRHHGLEIQVVNQLGSVLQRKAVVIGKICYCIGVRGNVGGDN